MCVPEWGRVLLMQILRSFRDFLVKEKLLTASGQQEYSEPSECPVVSVFN